MISNCDENFDGVDLNELFNDFDEKRSSHVPRQPLTKWGLLPRANDDELTEFNETDCTAPRINRKRTKNRKKTNAKQMTMYDYASSISYRHKQFYSSLDNTITSKTVTKGQKRSLSDPHQFIPIPKKSKANEYTKLSSSTPPDLIDNLLRYLDERSHYNTEQSTDEQEPLKGNEMKTKKDKSLVL